MNMNAFTQSLNQAAAAWWLFVLHVTWQASLLAALLVIVVLSGRRWPSPLRYWLLMLALLKFALPPLISLPTGLFSNVGPVVGAAHARPDSNIVALDRIPVADAEPGNISVQTPILLSN